MTAKEFKDIFYPSIPVEPGIYKFIGEDENILYVGKAKDLRKRLNSYFQKNPAVFKVKLLVRNSVRIDYTVVHSEHDALLLENTLIKKHQPRYNVMLKDGKSYSYIRIRKENFPRVEFTRKVIRDGSVYFGPFTSKYKVNILLDLIKRLFKVRTCKLNLTEKNINAGKFKVCLEFHIKNCMGPCEGLQSEREYNEMIDQVKNVLKGHFKLVKDYIVDKMHYYAGILEFEKAQEFKEKLIIFEDYQAKSTVVSPSIKDLDVFYIDSEDDCFYVNFLKVVNGSIITAETVKLEKNLDEDKESALRFAISHLREKYNSISPELILPFRITTTIENIVVTVPRKGDKFQLLEMSRKNVRYFMIQNKANKEESKRTTPSERILNTLKTDLQMDKIPIHIECFDNSNLHGTNPVASCVVFKNAKPSKKDYRHFNIKTVEGINDFASMEEIVLRRYKRLIEEEKELPQLIIIDGGKGQLSSAMHSIDQLGIKDEVMVIGIAKRLEEIYFPHDPVPLYINKKSESLKLIQQLRNEAHRFAITFHRDQRSKKFIDTKLKDIPGVGEKSISKLLRHFKSVEKIKEATFEDLMIIVGKTIAGKIIKYFHPLQSDLL
ncbi:MAG: excinuclease ABC subunit C [Saprospiraceae bacterium]|nr:excinuclease ABC subunit C [Saprospiraceae bacterium]